MPFEQSSSFGFSPMLSGSIAGDAAARSIADSTKEDAIRNIESLLHGMSKQRCSLLSEAGTELIQADVPMIRYGTSPFVVDGLGPFRVDFRFAENSTTQIQYYVNPGRILKSMVQNDLLTVSGIGAWTNLTLSGGAGKVFINIPISDYVMQPASILTNNTLDLSAHPWTTGGIVEAVDNSSPSSPQSVLRLLLATVSLSAGTITATQISRTHYKPRSGFPGVLGRAATLLDPL